MTQGRIYHHPQCSKSRATLKLLQERGVVLEIVDYRQQPPSLPELDRICRGLKMQPMALMRRSEARFTELGLDGAERPRDDLLRVLHENPILIQRPIVEIEGQFALGRPPENVLALLAQP